jgi:hypothetical protein
MSPWPTRNLDNCQGLALIASIGTGGQDALKLVRPVGEVTSQCRPAHTPVGAKRLGKGAANESPIWACIGTPRGGELGRFLGDACVVLNLQW